MRVLFASSEVFPLAKTGGLADVSGALPAALAELGHDVRIIMPGYGEALQRAGSLTPVCDLGEAWDYGRATLVQGRLPGSNVPVWLIQCPGLYERPGGPYQAPGGADWEDNDRRFAFLSQVTARLCQDWSPAGWVPEVLHVNDWQTGLAPAYLWAWGSPRPRTVLTIHNMAYQGNFPANAMLRMDLPWEMFTIEGVEYWNQVSCLKAGMNYSHKLTTVSPTYAREIQTPEFGCGMDGILSHRAGDLTGVLNGADYHVWNPVDDPHLAVKFGPALEHKAANKEALQRELGLPVAPDAPLMVVISRLNWHKGMDMVLAAAATILGQGAQLAVLGTGDRDLENGFKALAASNRGQVSVTIGYSEPLAHRMQAGGDMLLMPSRHEPCGLTQLYAMRYGCVPVVHRTGGLADTVTDTGRDTLLAGSATGFVCDQASTPALQWCVERAIAAYRQPETWRKIQSNGVRQDFSWEVSAKRYLAVYQSINP